MFPPRSRFRRSLPLVAVAVCILATSEANAAMENDCSKLQAQLDRLRLEIAAVKAELGSRCSLRNESEGSDGVLEPTKIPREPTPTQPLAAIHATPAMQQTTRPVPADAEHVRPARRSGDEQQYAVHCWTAGSAFADSSCNCLGEPAHPKLGSRRTIRIIVGSWHARLCKPAHTHTRAHERVRN